MTVRTLYMFSSKKKMSFFVYNFSIDMVILLMNSTSKYKKNFTGPYLTQPPSNMNAPKQTIHEMNASQNKKTNFRYLA